MKIKIMLLCLLISTLTYAQYPPEGDLSNPYELLETSTSITSGILLNKIYDQEPRSGLISDATFYPENILQAYSEWHKCASPEAGIATPDVLSSYYNQKKEDLNALPILVIDYDFHYLKPTAIADELILVSNGQYEENPEATESPYLEGHKFMAGIPEDVYLSTGELGTKVVYDSDLVISNREDLNTNTIFISSDGGSSFTELSNGETFTLPSSIESGSAVDLVFKMYTVENIPLVRKVTYKTSSQISCGAPPIDTPPWPLLQRTKVRYQRTGSHRTGFQVEVITTTFDVPNLIQADFAYNGSPAEGGAYVYYRHANHILPGEEGKLKKPIIICDGIDFKTGYYSGIINGKSGSLGWKELWGCNTDEYPLYDMEYGLNKLHDAGYDIIFLDYLDADDYIQNNAFLLVKLLQLVNANKVGNEQNVVVGASMGGQVARYALTYMEENNLNHCTRLNVSYDSPWKGAVIPAGVQDFVDFFRNSAPDPPSSLKTLYSGLNHHAASQLLIWHYAHNGPSPKRTQMMQELTNMGSHPKKCRNVAIADGNKKAIQNHQPGDYILNWVTYVCGTLAGKIWAYNGSGNKVFHGNIPFKTGPTDRYAGTLPNKFDNIPGGTRPNGRQIREETSIPWNGWVVNNILCQNWNNQVLISDFEDNPFIPTVSALNINTTDWFFNVETGLPKDYNADADGLTHFEAYWAPDVDLEHIETTVPMMDWLYDQIVAGEARLENEMGGTLTTAWNNPLENNYIDGLNINNGGTLYFNANRLNYDGTPAGVGSPPLGSLSKVSIGGPCSSSKIININAGGKMILGDVATNSAGENNRAYVYITDGAEVRINAGGELWLNKDSKLIVQDGGKLIINGGGIYKSINWNKVLIEDGGELVYNDNASINLSSYGSILELQGKLTVGDNADFTFTGNGRLVFDQNVKWGVNSSGNSYLKLDEYWDIGTNTTFTVEGPSAINMDHFLIEAFRPVYFKTENGSTFDQVTIRNGRVAFHQDALLFSFSPTNLRSVKFNAAYTWQTHGGFRLWNNPGPNIIWGCKFYNGDPAAFMHWVGGGNPITFTNCDFEDNEIGLRVEGGNFKVNGCDFNDNYQAIMAANLTGQSYINSSRVIGSNNAFHDGVQVHAQNGASLTVNSSKFSNCIDGLSLGADINARAYCSEFTLNGRYGILAATSSSLDIGNEAENVFTGNQWDDIYLTGDPQKSAIFMDEGFNDFAARGHQGGSYLQGRFSDGMPAFLGGINQIPANNNKMPTYVQGGQTFMPVDFTYKLTPGGSITNVTLDITTNLSSIQRQCTSSTLDDPGHSSHYRLVASFPSGGGIIYNPDYPDFSLKAAALDAIDKVSFGEDIRYDAVAVAKLSGILNADVSTPDAYTNRIRSAVYQQMHQALSNAYQNGGLVNVEGQSSNGVNATVTGVISATDQFILDLDPTNSTFHFLDFKYHLDKAHAYRVSGYYNEALTVLQTSTDWTHDSEQSDQAAYWQCICEAEDEYYNNELPEEEFGNQIASCNQSYYGNNYKRAEVNDVDNNAYAVDQLVEANDISLYPQPVVNELTLEVTTAFSGEVSFTISDVSGKVVQQGNWYWNGTAQRVDVSNLTTGVYFIGLQFENQADKAFKFMKK